MARLKGCSWLSASQGDDAPDNRAVVKLVDTIVGSLSGSGRVAARPGGAGRQLVIAQCELRCHGKESG